MNGKTLTRLYWSQFGMEESADGEYVSFEQVRELLGPIAGGLQMALDMVAGEHAKEVEAYQDAKALFAQLLEG